ncbi:hypothetical protein [Brevundimonas aurantiaca]|nr:hypothetical protein [Brevundimonas aurantiaca]
MILKSERERARGRGAGAGFGLVQAWGGAVDGGRGGARAGGGG